MRDTTERPEGIEAGTFRLVGTDEENIYNNFTLLLEDEPGFQSMRRRQGKQEDRGYSGIWFYQSVRQVHREK